MTNKPTFLEIISASLVAGDNKPFTLSGSYFEVIESAYPVDVLLTDRYGAQVGLMKDAETSFFIRGGEFQNIAIKSAQAQLIRFGYGSSEAGTRRTAGIVQVVDGGKARTLANTAFSGYASQTALAANFSHVQIWNPAGSGKRVMVEQCTAGSATATVLYYGIMNTALATLISTVPSKLSGGAASTAQLRSENNAAGLFAIGSSLIAKLNPVGNEMQWEPREPVILLPGFGLTARANVANQDLFSSFEFYEESI